VLRPRFLRAISCLGSLSSVLTTTVLLAQSPAGETMAWLDVGGARVQQPTSTLRSAGSVGGGLWYGRGHMALAGEGSLTVARDSVSAAQYVVRTTLLPGRWARTDIDVSATTNGLVFPGRNGNLSALLRQTVTWGAVELVGSAGGGRTSRLGLNTNGHAYSVGADVQRTLRTGTWRGGLTMQRSYTNDYQLMEASGIGLGDIAPNYALDDAVVQLSWQRGIWWMQANRGWREGRRATVGTASSFNVALAVNLNASTTLIAQGGEQMADVLRGVPQARYTGLAVRWNPVRPRTLRRDARPLADVRGTTGSGVVVVPDVRGDEVLLQRTEGQGVITISIIAPANAVVDIAVSSTDWTPVRMARTGDAFVHRLTLASGPHRIAVRINGGAWRAPRGLAPVNDEFGGKAGMVVIP
jgi:hypothetical protein